MRKGLWILFGFVVLLLVIVVAGNILGLVMGPGFDP